MNSTSFYHLIVREIGKSQITRMNLANFARIFRKRAHDISTPQLLFLYRELGRVKSDSKQLEMHSHEKKASQRFRPKDSKVAIKSQSFEKHLVICLQQIAIKLKEKHGYEEGVDLCKLYYFRLLNAMEYHLPYVNILEHFRQQFLLKELGYEVIDYVELIGSSTAKPNSLYIQTVNLIVQNVSQELQNIDILQLPYLKFVLAKGYTFGIYNISSQLFRKIDSLINQNKYAYTYRELQSALSSDFKNSETQQYYSLITKELNDKRINYLYIESLNRQCNSKQESDEPLITKQVTLPGKSIAQGFLQYSLNRMTQRSMYKPYVKLFQDRIYKQKRITNSHTMRQFINYHFRHFIAAGNKRCQVNQVIQILKNTLQNEQTMKQNGLKYSDLQMFKLVEVMLMLCRNQTQQGLIAQSHRNLEGQLKTMPNTPKLKTQNMDRTFQRSLKSLCIREENYLSLKPLFQAVSKHLNCLSHENGLNEELEIFTSGQRSFIISELIIWLLKFVRESESHPEIASFGKLLQIITKYQYRKFSQQSAYVSKIISLMSKNSYKSDDSGVDKNEEKQLNLPVEEQNRIINQKVVKLPQNDD